MRAAPSFCLLFALAAAACGGGAGDDDTRADGAPAADSASSPDAAAAVPLLVTGTLRVANTGNLAVDANDRVDVEVRVRRGGQPVTNAVVRINPAPPAFQTFLAGVATDPSLYTGSYMGYHDTARITVTAGTDGVPETTLIGVALFQITDPTSGATVVDGSDLPLHWTREETASSLEVSTEGGYDSGSLADATDHTVPGSSISITTAADRVTVARWRRNMLPGAADGSYIDFGVATSLPFSVVAP